MEAACTGEDRRWFTNEVTGKPRIEASINEIFHGGRHVAKPGGRAQDQA
jgi:hypothetical protein